MDWLESLHGVDITVAIDQPMMGDEFRAVPTFNICIVEEDGGRLLGHGKTLREAIDAAALDNVP